MAELRIGVQVIEQGARRREQFDLVRGHQRAQGERILPDMPNDRQVIFCGGMQRAVVADDLRPQPKDL